MWLELVCDWAGVCGWPGGGRARRRRGRDQKREDEDEDEDEVVENEGSTKPVNSGPPSVPGHRDTWGTHDPAQFAHSVRFLSLAQPWGELQLLL